MPKTNAKTSLPLEIRNARIDSGRGLKDVDCRSSEGDGHEGYALKNVVNTDPMKF